VAPELGSRPVEPDPDRLYPRALQLGDLLSRKFLEFEQDHEGSVSLTHSIERCVDQAMGSFLGHLLRRERPLRRHFGGLLLLGRAARKDPSLAPGPSTLMPHHELGDPVEPDDQSLPTLEFMQAAERDEKDLLHGVVDLDSWSAQASHPDRNLLVMKGEDLPDLERLRLRRVRAADFATRLNLPARWQPQQEAPPYKKRMPGSAKTLRSPSEVPGQAQPQRERKVDRGDLGGSDRRRPGQDLDLLSLGPKRGPEL